VAPNLLKLQRRGVAGGAEPRRKSTQGQGKAMTL
jgi:hypothetical protein